MEECGIDEKYYLGERDLEMELPWDMVDCGVTKEYFISERNRAIEEVLTRDCRNGCTNCGICSRFGLDMIVEKR